MSQIRRKLSLLSKNMKEIYLRNRRHLWIGPKNAKFDFSAPFTVSGVNDVDKGVKMKSKPKVGHVQGIFRISIFPGNWQVLHTPKDMGIFQGWAGYLVRSGLSTS